MTCSVSGCAPPFSVKLTPVTAPANPHVVVIDERQAKDKAYHIAWGNGYRAYLADSNTTPDRMTVLRATLNAAIPEDQKIEVRVQNFDILMNFSGMVVGTFSTMTCTLTATVGSAKLTGVSSADYLGSADSESGARAAEACVNRAIQAWLAVAPIARKQ
ncbi:MAG: hypothetical protein JSS42_16270 [Proteobacteria bacterium]|nr:hypothetical protein [Pseudomonadota bacterium]